MLSGGALAATTLATRTAGLVRQDGFIPFYWDVNSGKLLFELSPTTLDHEFLYFSGLGSGVGSTQMFADRSSPSESLLCRFRRIGPRVLVIAENTGYRATAGTPELQHSVAFSFPTTVLAALPIEAEQDGAVLVNANPLVVRDAFNLLQQLRYPARVRNGTVSRAAQPAAGNWRLDADRSAVDIAHTHGFPRNTEVQALLTFTSDNPVGAAAAQIPEASGLTVREHHSFLPLPLAGFETREYDPRVGFENVDFEDFSQPYEQPLLRRLTTRWRLQKKDPTAAVSEPVQPIVFYLDQAIPEPIRSAARRGALWWNEAFERAGFKNALVIKDLPLGADPLDVRYPTIQWTNRSGRGWSVGNSQVDPRTGEILHAVVQLDSHRIRTVNNYWEALGAKAGQGDGALGRFAALDGLDPQLSEEQVMLNRIALLTCHEMGHVLGLQHNFLASTFDRGSVMDYFAPRITMRADGTADMSDAYMQHTGSYDRFAMQWGYAPTLADPVQEQARQEAVIRAARAHGIVFGNPADPRWNAYDDGPDPVTWLERVMPVRDALLAHYGWSHLRPGEPASALASRFALVYLFHQYGLGSALNVIGGAEVPPMLAGDGQTPLTVWPEAEQRKALALELHALRPDELAIPHALWQDLVPPETYGADPERFGSTAGYLFNPYDAARAVADIVVNGLLDPERLERVAVLHREQAGALSPAEVISALQRQAFAPAADAQQDLAAVVSTDVAEQLMRLAVDDQATAEVQAAAWDGVRNLQHVINTGLVGAGAAQGANLHRLQQELTLFERDPRRNTPPPHPSLAPPGPPV